MFGALLAFASEASAAPATDVTSPPPSVRFIYLNGDGLTDKLLNHGDSISISINLSGGVFAEEASQLPFSALVDVLVGDLNGDGLIDLYLVSQGENAALLGDGTGVFYDATQRLGLGDAGHGVSAERMAFDVYGDDALVLHNANGDVLFWPAGSGFERDSSTPALPQATAPGDVGLLALEGLVAGAAELLALDPGEELVLSLDEAGLPRVSLGSRRSQASASLSTGGVAGVSGLRAGRAALAVAAHHRPQPRRSPPRSRRSWTP